jgi:uncharacterized UBP type Zn finger protein
MSQAPTPGAHADGADHAGRRPCRHLAVARAVEPHSTGCQECLDRGSDWVELWLCLSCGWVACSDHSPKHHARLHYEETDHPVAIPLRHGPSPIWCHVHQRAM